MFDVPQFSRHDVGVIDEAPDDSAVEVGQLISAIRVSRQMSPVELARRAEVDIKTVRGVENGRRWPQDVTRAKLENALGISPGSISLLLQDGDSRRQLWQLLRTGELSGSWPIASAGESATASDHSSDELPDGTETSGIAHLDDLVDQAKALWPIGKQLLIQVEGRGFDDHSTSIIAAIMADLSVTTADGLYEAIEDAPALRPMFAPGYGEAMLAFRRFVDYHDRLVPPTEALNANKKFVEGVSALGHFSGDAEPFFRWSDAKADGDTQSGDDLDTEQAGQSEHDLAARDTGGESEGLRRKKEQDDAAERGDDA